MTKLLTHRQVQECAHFFTDIVHISYYYHIALLSRVQISEPQLFFLYTFTLHITLFFTACNMRKIKITQKRFLILQSAPYDNYDTLATYYRLISHKLVTLRRRFC